MHKRILIAYLLILPFVSRAQLTQADNGLTVTGGNKVQLRGTLNQNTDIDLGTSFVFNFKKSTTNYFSVINNGNVGIGTASPSFKLDVNGTSAFRNTLKVDFGTTNQNIQLKDDGIYFNRPSGNNSVIYGVNSFLQYISGTSHRFFLNIGEVMTMDDNGYIGINKNPPSARLHIFTEGNTSATTAFLVQNSSSADLIKIKNDKTIEFQGTSAVLTSGGNFGLGATSPSAQLHTTGTVRFAGVANDNAAPRVLASDSLGNVKWRAVTSINNSNWNTTGTTLYNINSGFVGIGTSVSPDSSDTQIKLAVKGNIYAKKLKVTQTGWADFVFDKDYKLPTLAFVENYIAQHKHLPDVPSAEAIQKNGLDVGDNQALLLRKIEELTLYAIEQNKRIELLEKELKAMKDTKPK